MSDQSFMQRFGERLIDNGYPVIPIIPGNKVPGKFTSGNWVPYAGWSKHCDRPTTQFEIGIWNRWPGCGIGVACGRVAAVDIDVAEDAEVALRVEALALKMLGDTPAVRIGQPPKRLLVYRTREPFKKIKEAPLEVLCHGQQFVACGVHPGTGKDYYWPNESLVDIPLSDLPEIDEDKARKFMAAAIEIVPPDLRVAKLGPDMSAEFKQSSDLEGTYEGVEAALQYISNNDLHYDDWVKIGLAIKGALGEDGQDLFYEWSARSTKHQDKETGRAWASFRPDSIGAGTLYYYAQDAGWVPPMEITLNAEAARSKDVIDIQSITQSLLESSTQRRGHEERLPEAAKDIDPAIFGLTGALKDMVDWIVSTSYKPQPFLALGASLSALGAAMGRRYTSPTDLRSNIYAIGIANSGSGKEHARRCVREMFYEAGLARYMGGDRIASGPAIVSALQRHPVMMFQLDEFGHMLNAILNQRNAPKYLTEIMTNLTQISTSASGVFGGTEYAISQEAMKASDDSAKGPVMIVNPHVCINATTTPGQFWSALKAGAVADGSLARYLVFATPENYPDSQFNAMRGAPSTLLDAVKTMAAGDGAFSSLMSHSIRADPRVVPYGPNADEMMRELDRVQTERLREFDESPLASIIGRTLENTIKCALIAAVSDDPETPLIECRHLEWASVLINHCVATVLNAVEDEVAESGAEVAKKRLLRVVKDAGGTIGKSDLIRGTQFLRARERNELVQDLIDGGQMLMVNEKNKGPGRPKTVFVAIPDKERRLSVG